MSSRKRYSLDRTVELLCLNSDSDDMDTCSESDSDSDHSCDLDESVLPSTYPECPTFKTDHLSPILPSASSVAVESRALSGSSSASACGSSAAFAFASTSTTATASTSASGTASASASSSPQWKFVTENNDTRSELPPFLGIPGLCTPHEERVLSSLEDDEICRNVINCFLTDELLATLVRFTNIRAELYLRTETLKPQSRFRSWTDCNFAEMKKFVALILLMGVVKKPQLTDYWSTDDLLCTPLFHSELSLTRDRFLLILHFIRFANYENLGCEENCLRKIQPFVDIILSICKNVYKPSQNLTVDESLLLYKGRLFFKQYIPAKRRRFGIKIYFLCESESGFTSNFCFHTVKSDHDNFASECVNLSVSERVVVHLCQEYLDMGYFVWCDNWFNSVRLATFLLSRKTLLIGTLRPNRGVPPLLQGAVVNVRDTKFLRSGDLLLSKFCDKKASGKKLVFMIDAKNKAEFSECERFVKGGKRISFKKSVTMSQYNKCMGGVDRADQILHAYDATRKSYRWFHKIGIHLLQRMCLNAHIVYTVYGGKRNFQGFLMSCVRLFLHDTGVARQPLIRHVSSATKSHFPSKFQPRGKNAHPTKRCRVCYSNGRIKKTTVYCETCPGKPGLCMTPCFANYHSK